MHESSHSKMEWFKNNYLDVSNNLKILDIGSLDNVGDYNYRDIFDETNWDYVGLDIVEGNNVDLVITDIYNWFEIDDNSYDVIISGQFFEHLKYFWLTFSQIERVLKPGGYICIIVPSSGPKHNENMLDCYRFHESGLIAMAEYVDLDVLHASVDMSEEAKPWYDACLVAHKSKSGSSDDSDVLELRMDSLENKLDVILESLQK